MSERVVNLWVIGHESGLDEFSERVTEMVNCRNESRRLLCARRRLRMRANDRRMAELSWKSEWRAIG